MDDEFEQDVDWWKGILPPHFLLISLSGKHSARFSCKHTGRTWILDGWQAEYLRDLVDTVNGLIDENAQLQYVLNAEQERNRR